MALREPIQRQEQWPCEPFLGPPVTLSITCQTGAQPKKSRFESSLSFMYDGSFSLICLQIVLRQNSGDISSQKFV